MDSISGPFFFFHHDLLHRRARKYGLSENNPLEVISITSDITFLFLEHFILFFSSKEYTKIRENQQLTRCTFNTQGHTVVPTLGILPIVVS